jgi:peptidoglycan/LPS O-acetylase OafA/YrhL
MHDASAPDREHHFWIDALRGIAAIIVLISHVSLFGLYGYEHVLAKWPPTRLLWSGHQAVILFFVISGFALYLLFEQMAAVRGRWLKFIAVRFLRLYPPYLASLVLALLVLKAPALFGMAAPPNSPVIANGHLTAGTLFGHLLMIGQFDVEAINPPIWTLVYEARLSLLFPLIYLAVAKGGCRTLAVLGGIWVAGICYTAAHDLDFLPEGGPIPYTIRRTVDLSLMFFVGAIIAKYRLQIARWMSTRRPSVLVALSGLAVFVFMYSFGYDWVEWTSESVRHIAEEFTAAASAFFVALAIFMPAPRKRGVPAFFGNISYSLYLVHQVAIMAVVLLLYGQYPAPLMWVISIAASIGLAWLFYLAIEKPSKAASRRLRLESARSTKEDNSAIRAAETSS